MSANGNFEKGKDYIVYVLLLQMHSKGQAKY